MKNRFLLLFALAIGSASARETASFNEGWKFARFGEMPDGSQRAEPAGLEQSAFDDSGWRALNVPHDWGIEGPFRPDLPNQTGKLPWAGIGWYRKTFDVPAEDRGKRVYIEFDGSMSQTKVWLNGAYVGEWRYGYTSFRLDLTDHLAPGETNHLAVRLDNMADSSRWYPGGGIYRNVRIVKTAPTAIAHWGVFVTTPKVSESAATVLIDTQIDGPSEGVSIRHEILTESANPKKVAAQSASPGSPCSIAIQRPRIWSLESPQLYRVRTTLSRDGKEIDRYDSVFGIRTIEYSATQGFLLNGKIVRMNGVCQHHDLGPLGAAINTRALERQIEILQSMGCNAIRTAHNPPAPELLDLCDRMGMLVQVEAFDAWARQKAPNDYGLHFADWHERDLRSMVRRDRNHPSVVMWSTGNEVLEFDYPEEASVSQRLTDIIRSEDATRPVSFGGNKPDAGFNGFEKTIDVFGYNYKPHLYERFRQSNATQPLYGSETASTVSSRGEYFFPVSEDKKAGSGGYFQVSSYDFSAPNWANRPDIEFEAQDKYPWVFGEFVWTGFDYIGEPTPYNKDKTNLLNFSDPAERERMKAELARLGSNIPPRSSYFGIVDLCGFPKDRFYLYQARWRPELPMAHILPHWNWPERVGQTTPVHVYTSGDSAELFLNGKSLGRKTKGEFEYRLRWDDVVYQPGALKVVAYKNGKKWAQDENRTTGPAAQITLAADRTTISADGADLSFVTVQVSDASGALVPRTHNSVTYTLDGPGEIIAIGNGDPTNHESFQAATRKVFNGLALVVIRSKKGESGRVKLTARSPDLKSASATIAVKR